MSILPRMEQTLGREATSDGDQNGGVGPLRRHAPADARLEPSYPCPSGDRVCKEQASTWLCAVLTDAGFRVDQPLR